METIERLALTKLAGSKNCAQSTFFALEQHFKLEGGPMLKALSPFPGIALRGETCGAVTGAMLALGLVFGSDEGSADLDASYAPVREFCQRLEELKGSLQCSVLLEHGIGRSIDFTSPIEVRDYSASNGPAFCAGIVTTAVQIAAEIIERERKAR
jgi:C_GCAxxG_C_C family probable redox protein